MNVTASFIVSAIFVFTMITGNRRFAMEDVLSRSTIAMLERVGDCAKSVQLLEQLVCDFDPKGVVRLQLLQQRHQLRCKTSELVVPVKCSQLVNNPSGANHAGLSITRNHTRCANKWCAACSFASTHRV